MIRSVDSANFDSDDARFYEAVCYLLDEMSPEQSERFEEQLATDQSLRELLAEAVQLTQATYETFVPHSVPTEHASVASPETAAPGNGNWQFGLTLALAASLLIALTGGLSFYLASVNQEIASPGTISEDVQLASAWVNQLESQTDEIPGLWDDELLALPSLEVPLEENSDDPLLAGAPAAPPAWMLKALAAEQDETTSHPAM
ncbi:hypothetical protein [Blastopirellula marina]|uniref:Zinc-finger domain-containing protein n=1 Tax=Blastopirellula marina TaxID=124 RepID=A0A2S8F810_9BACT|nr:hypothetical protein [Blastopirellula marina]PQO28286.1 hypothetical protein C5Y98_25660 [Blastopirellula marina]PTL41826.1 hypothetical protein C5Y97_25675 [Blastopirellula marina]